MQEIVSANRDMLYISLLANAVLLSITRRLTYDLTLAEAYDHTPVDRRYPARLYSTFELTIPDLLSPSFRPSPLIFLVNVLYKSPCPL